MASLDMLQIRNLLKKGVIGQIGDDLSVAITVKYCGKGSPVSVVVAATKVTLKSSLSETELKFEDFSTVGAMVDAINSQGEWCAKPMDALSNTALDDDYLITGTLVADEDGQFNLKLDTSEVNFMAYRLTYDRTFGTNQKLRNGHRVSILEIITDLTLGDGSDVNAFKIYESHGGKDKLIYQKTPTSGSISTTNWASGNGKITGGEGSDLVVVVNDSTSITGTITVIGESE